MASRVGNLASALLRASHFGPALIVTFATFCLSLTNFTVVGSIQIAAAIFAGQLVVGWTNELVDFPLDSAAKRKKKPLVAGLIEIEFLRNSTLVMLPSALIISLMSPLALRGTAIHFLGLLSATIYNFRLKSTRFSVVSYIISFGLLPWAVYLAAEKVPPTWLYIVFILFASAFHFLNVIKDLEWDLRQNVLGLPQRLGREKSIIFAIVLALVALAITAYGLTA